MRVLCPACERLVSLAVFRVEGAALFVTCDRCGVESPAVAAPAPAADTTPLAPVPSGDPFAVPADRCPKCAAARTTDAENCAACGLVFAQAPAEGYRPSEETAAQWGALLQVWNDWEAHQRLIAAASIQGDLAEVGRLYRLRLAAAPSDELALRGREEVLRLATMASTFSVKTPPSDGSTPAWQFVVLGVVVLLLVGLMVVLFHQLQTARL